MSSKLSSSQKNHSSSPSPENTGPCSRIDGQKIIKPKLVKNTDYGDRDPRDPVDPILSASGQDSNRQIINNATIPELQGSTVQPGYSWEALTSFKKGQWEQATASPPLLIEDWSNNIDPTKWLAFRRQWGDSGSFKNGGCVPENIKLNTVTDVPGGKSKTVVEIYGAGNAAASPGFPSGVAKAAPPADEKQSLYSIYRETNSPCKTGACLSTMDYYGAGYYEVEARAPLATLHPGAAFCMWTFGRYREVYNTSTDVKTFDQGHKVDNKGWNHYGDLSNLPMGYFPDWRIGSMVNGYYNMQESEIDIEMSAERPNPDFDKNQPVSPSNAPYTGKYNCMRQNSWVSAWNYDPKNDTPPNGTPKQTSGGPYLGTRVIREDENAFIDGNWHTYGFAWSTTKVTNGGFVFGNMGQLVPVDVAVGQRIDFYFDRKLIQTVTRFVPAGRARLVVGIWFPFWGYIDDYDKVNQPFEYTLWQINGVRILPKSTNLSDIAKHIPNPKSVSTNLDEFARQVLPTLDDSGDFYGTESYYDDGLAYTTEDTWPNPPSSSNLSQTMSLNDVEVPSKALK